MVKRIFVVVGIVIVVAIVILMNIPINISRGGPDYRSVRAYLKEDYSMQFDNKEFTLESFNLSNAKDFSYRYYEDEGANDGIGQRFFWINLTNTGKQNAQNALDKLIDLEFIDHVAFYYHGAYPGILLE